MVIKNPRFKPGVFVNQVDNRNQKPRLRGVLDFYGEGGKFALHKFPDGNFARARPRGVRLSAYGFKLTQRCGLQIPAA